MDDPITQAEEVLRRADRSFRAEKQSALLARMTGCSPDEADSAYAIYVRELKALAGHSGLTVEDIQRAMGETRCLLLLGMITGGVRAGVSFVFTPEGEPS